MSLTTHTEFKKIEQWLIILTTTYAKNSSPALANTIVYYLQRIIKHEDFVSSKTKQCDYLAMLRYWHWCVKNR